MVDPVIVAEDLGRRFGRRDALQAVTFDLAAGEVLGVVGPDGAGKTTLLQMLAGILRPSAGTCRVLGEDVRRRPDRVQARVGYMSQGFTLYERLTVAENIAFAADIRDVPRDVFEARKARLVAMAGLERFQDRREGALSGGMRKKRGQVGDRESASPTAPLIALLEDLRSGRAWSRTASRLQRGCRSRRASVLEEGRRRSTLLSRQTRGEAHSRAGLL